MKNKMLLDLHNCSLSFGGIKALTHFNAGLHEQEILGIIGPNGAGKTTLFNIVTGVYQPDSGHIHLEGKSIDHLQPFQINKRGIARTFQNIRLFKNLTVLENVLVAFHHTLQTTLADALFLRKKMKEEEANLREKANGLLKLFGLYAKKQELANNLAYGEQRKLEIVRALASNPKVLLLDEPAAGMNATEKKELMDLIRKIYKEYRLGIILIEHDMSVVMTLCPRIIVLDYGVIIAEGTPSAVRNNPKVIEAYLGKAN